MDRRKRGNDIPVRVKPVMTVSVEHGKLSPIYFPPRDCSSPLGDINDSLLLQSPKRERSYIRRTSDGAISSLCSTLAMTLLPPFPSKTTVSKSHETNESTPEQLSTLLSSSTADDLLYAPSLKDTFHELEINSKDVDFGRHKLSSDRIPSASQGEQRTISPSPFPSPLGSSQRRVIAKKFVTPDSPPLQKRSRPSPRSWTPPLKKRMLAAYPLQHSLENPQRYHNPNQEKQQPHLPEKALKRMSMAVPSLLMNLKHNASSTKRPATSAVRSSSVSRSTKSSSSSPTKAPRSYKKHALQKSWKKMYPTQDTQLSRTETVKKKAFVNCMFPLPALPNRNRNDEKHFIIPPSLLSYRRQWDLLSTRNGHINEYLMDHHEREQLVRESFGRAISRHRIDLSKKYRNKSWIALNKL